MTLPANVHYVWPHQSRRFLYAATSDSASGVGGFVGNKHHVSALTVDPATGALALHGAPVPLPTRPIHMATDIPSEYILVAFSNPSGLKSPRQPRRHRRRRGDAARSGRSGHLRASGAGGARRRRVILVARGHDAAGGKPEEPGCLKVFNWAGGQLSAEKSIAPGDGYGFGPRHLDFHPSKPWVYVSLERQNRIDMFDFTAGTLSATPVFSETTLGTGKKGGRQAAGTVHVHPNGRFVYVANRASALVNDNGWRVFAGGENTLAVYAIDQSTGKPSPIQFEDTRGYHCRTFHIDPTGRLLVAAHIQPVPVKEGDGVTVAPATMSVFRIGDDGKPSLHPQIRCRCRRRVVVVDGDGRAAGLSPPDIGHLGRHHGHEEDVRLGREARHIGDAAGDFLDVYPGLGLDPAGGLQAADRGVLVAGRRGVADVDLAAGDANLRASRDSARVSPVMRVLRRGIGRGIRPRHMGRERTVVDDAAALRVCAFISRNACCAQRREPVRLASTTGSTGRR